MPTEKSASTVYNAPHWDIFCVVVDNYGDIGVTWRLAKQLAAEHQLVINLWVDDLNSFSHILPTLDITLAKQSFFGVNILKWNTPLDTEYIPGTLLIEAFACELPSQVLQVIEKQHQVAKQNLSKPAIATTAVTTAVTKPPVWINLEYLSAEDWVDGCHGLPSMQASGVKKHFYFPGFTAQSGGLLCESRLFNLRDQWQADFSNKLALFEGLGLTGIAVDDFVVSVFSYETKALTALCQYWASGKNQACPSGLPTKNLSTSNASEDEKNNHSLLNNDWTAESTSTKRVHALFPMGKSLTSILSIINVPLDSIKPGQQYKVGNLTIHIIPMTDQNQFDRLLWSCDFNIVRGEDSFLRAQWAAKPFIWHIYPQEDDYHLVKLQAFVNIYCLKLETDAANTWSKTNFAFNQQDDNVVEYWQQLISAQSELQHHAKHWPIDAKKDADLVSRLVEFVKTS